MMAYGVNFLNCEDAIILLHQSDNQKTLDKYFFSFDKETKKLQR